MKTIVNIGIVLSILFSATVALSQSVTSSGDDWVLVTENTSGKLLLGTRGAEDINLVTNQSGGAVGWNIDGTTGNMSGIGGASIDFSNGILVGAGTAAAPSIAFLTDANSGMYSISDNNLGFSVNGALAFRIASGKQAFLYGQAQGLDGTASVPTYSAQSDSNTGVFFPSADVLGITVGGTETFAVGSNVVLVGGDISPLDTSGSLAIVNRTSDGSDNKIIEIHAGGGKNYVGDRGAFIQLNGNETGSKGGLTLRTGNLANGNIEIQALHSAGFVNIKVGGSAIGVFSNGGLDVTGELSISGAATSGGVLCVKSDGDIGQCTDAVGSGGTCTCS